MVLSMLKIDKEDGVEESPVISLLSEAISGISKELGLGEPVVEGFKKK